MQARFLHRAVGAGYSHEEHDEPWGLFGAAAGRDQPLGVASEAFDGYGRGGRDELLAELEARTVIETWRLRHD